MSKAGYNVGFSAAATLLIIAENVLLGEMAAQARDFDDAILHLDKAVRLEDSLLYNEPPDCFWKPYRLGIRPGNHRKIPGKGNRSPRPCRIGETCRKARGTATRYC